MSKDQGVKTALYCEGCGGRLLWKGELEPKLEPNGTLRGFTLHAVCVLCRSKYQGWLYVGAAPEWWKVERPDKSSGWCKHETLKNYRAAAARRRRRLVKAQEGNDRG
jgi:hypothetical protein